MGFISKVLGLLKGIFGLSDFECGSLVVAPCEPGEDRSCRQEIFVKTCGCPKKVWLSLSHCDNLPVCCGDIDFASCAQILPDGFIIHVIINSGCCKIEWFVAE